MTDLSGACPEEGRYLSQACNIKFAQGVYECLLLMAGEVVRCLDE